MNKSMCAGLILLTTIVLPISSVALGQEKVTVVPIGRREGIWRNGGCGKFALDIKRIEVKKFTGVVDVESSFSGVANHPISGTIDEKGKMMFNRYVSGYNLLYRLTGTLDGKIEGFVEHPAGMSSIALVLVGKEAPSCK